MRLEDNTIPGREIVDSQWVPESKFMSHNSKISCLQIFFCLPVWIYKGKDKEMLPSSLNQAPLIDLEG